MGAQGLPRGARVRVKLGDIDLVSLDIHGTVLERLDTEPELFDADEEQDDDGVVGPITIAVHHDEAEAKPPAGEPGAPDAP
jgi:exoribonuclease-2